ncbi:MAG: RnfABCDGE type electron transport complex subunit D [Thiolinea sp.]
MPGFPRRQIDPRYYQAAVQLGLLIWGTALGYFVVPAAHILAVLTAAALTQWAFTRFHGLRLNLLSTLNTALSILLLLHAAHWGWLALAALLSVGSKFLLRLQNRHIFNPSNIGIVLVLLTVDASWVAHGKWGHAIWLALLLAGAGLILLLGWKQMTTSLAFLLSYTLLLLTRAFWLGDPLAIPLHQLQNGALLIFVFFMLSDPMTTPEKLSGRIIYGSWVALFAAWLQFQWFIPNAFLYALACSSPLVLLINYKFKGSRFAWGIRRME